MAAETSLDAKVPVFLALLKLNLSHMANHYYIVRIVNNYNAYNILLLIILHYVPEFSKFYEYIIK